MPTVTIHRVVFPAGFELPAPRTQIDPLYARGGPDIEVVDRTTVRLRKGQLLSTDAYFNRLPAGYWQRWTRAHNVHMSLRGRGHARVVLRRSYASGAQNTVRLVEADLGDGLRWPVDLSAFAAGGNLWVEVEALDEHVTVQDIRWESDCGDGIEARTDLAITTFNRPADVFALLTSLRQDPEALAAIDTVWLVDNGTKSYTDIPGADDLTAAWGERLRRIEQANLGGSGGFARGMWEAISGSDCPFVMMLDDDVVVEPESLRRAVVMAAIAREPLSVGLQMLSRAEPTVVNSLAEWVDTTSMRITEAPGSHRRFDVAGASQGPATRIENVLDAGYNGWWACLVPTDSIRKAGLPLPLFIKWDDVEYAYRLARHGVRTVTLMGSAVWHEPLWMKEQATDWTVYFYVRNWLIFTAVMSAGLPKRIRQRRVERVVTLVLLRFVVRNLLRRSYASAAIAEKAMRDFLQGPDLLSTPLDEVVGQVRAYRDGFPDAELGVPGAASREVPRTRFRKQPRLPLGLPRSALREFGLVPPNGSRRPGQRTGDAWRIWQMPDREAGPAELPNTADEWWGMVDVPDAWVATIDGGQATRRTRRPDLARSLMKDSVTTARAVTGQFARLAEEYAAALPELTSPEAWAAQFANE